MGNMQDIYSSSSSEKKLIESLSEEWGDEWEFCKLTSYEDGIKRRGIRCTKKTPGSQQVIKVQDVFYDDSVYAFVHRIAEDLKIV